MRSQTDAESGTIYLDASVVRVLNVESSGRGGHTSIRATGMTRTHEDMRLRRCLRIAAFCSHHAFKALVEPCDHRGGKSGRTGVRFLCDQDRIELTQFGRRRIVNVEANLGKDGPD
jgi:hypothetical protein